MSPSPEILPMQVQSVQDRNINKPTPSTILQTRDNAEQISNSDEPYSTFSAGTRLYLTYALGLIMILSTLTATIYFPLIPTLSTHFHVSIQAINLTVTVYAICQAVSPVIFASLADSYGRRPALLALVLIYSMGSLGLVLNKDSYPALMALRAVQSIGGSAITPISYGIVADLMVTSERGKMLGPMMATCNAISAAGPVIGGAIALKTGGHTWVFVALLIIAVGCLMVVGFTIPETARIIAGNGSKPVHGIWRTWTEVIWGPKREKRRPSRRTGHATEDHEARPSPSRWKVFDAIRIIRYPDAAVILWMVASSYGIYYTFQVAIPAIFDDVYNYNQFEIGLVLVPGLVGMTVGGMIAGKLIDANYAKVARTHSVDIVKERTRTRLTSLSNMQGTR